MRCGLYHRFNWWLGSVASSTNFANVNNNGNANNNNASNANGFRPFLLSLKNELSALIWSTFGYAPIFNDYINTK